MSKQLAISSSFCTFALAALALLHTPGAPGWYGADRLLAVQAESPAFDLPLIALLRD